MSIDAKGRHGFSVALQPSSTIRLKRKFEKSQDLNVEPILNYTSSGLMINPRVTISCADGLKFYFRKIGMRGDFSPEGQTEDIDTPQTRLIARYDGLCLRNNGYMIAIVKS